ncbi:MAG: radical SAM protein [Magnetococcales bacterium]|nr:radical SAM protein [Magnetococcales bacterium]
MAAFNTLHNRFKIMRNYYTATDRPAYPQEVVIELTNHCNLACIMCPHQTMQRPKGRMSAGLFQKIIDEIAGHTDLVYLYGTGETLLHKQFPELTHYAHARGIATCISTNGMIMNETMALNLLTCGLDFLTVALDGGIRETYERIRVKGDFALLVQNIHTLLRVKKETGSTTRITLQMICMPENLHEIALFKALFTKEEHALLHQFRFKPLHKTYLLERQDIRHTRPCFWLWNMMSIYWDGTVPLCCTDADGAVRLGRVTEQTIHDIWHAEPLRAIRRAHQLINYDTMPLCRSCNIPEQGYFNNLTIPGSLLVGSAWLRKLVPLYERLIMLPFQRMKGVPSD